MRFHRAGPVGYVTIDRPQVLNALDQQTHAELARAWDEFDADDDLRAAAASTLALPEAFAARYEWEERRMRSRDAREGPAAFAEKRPPRWEGR